MLGLSISCSARRLRSDSLLRCGDDRALGLRATGLSAAPRRLVCLSQETSARSFSFPSAARLLALAMTLAVASALLFVPAAHAQLPSPELHEVDPPAAAAGETLVVTLSGLHLEELGALHFSDPRIVAEAVMLPDSEFRKHPARDGTRFRVTLPAEVEEGLVEVRASGPLGFTTSRAFAVLAPGTGLQAKAGSVHHRRESAPELALETVAYGRFDAGQIDWWRFRAEAGQRLLVHCQAERIDSRADAVLAVVDAGGRELERSRRAVGRDPLLDFTATEDGDYWVGVHDLLHNGGAGYSYLLSVSARPWIDAVWPPAVPAGGSAEVTLIGRNLPGGSPGEGLLLEGKPVETLAVRLQAPEGPDPLAFFPGRPAGALLPVFAWRHEGEGGSNPVRIALAETPVGVRPGGGETLEITVPGEIAGRFELPGEAHRYRFEGKAGTAYWIESVGERLSGEIDPYLAVERIEAADGSETYHAVAEHDDDPGLGGPSFDGGTRDASLAFVADEDAAYRVSVFDQYAGTGPDRIYRLLVSEARPGFELLVVAEREHLENNQVFPAAPFLRKGGTASVRVLVRRTGGFDGPVTLEASGLPEGVDSPPVVVPGKEETARLVFRAAPEAPDWAGSVVVTGRASAGVGGEESESEEITSVARAASVVWGLPDRTRDRLRTRANTSLPLAVSGVEVAPAAIALAAEGPLRVAMGGTLEIPVKVLSREGVKGPLNVSIEGLRGLVRPPAVDLAEGAEEGKLSLAFTEQRNIFSPEAGTWSFVLKATGTASHRLHPEAAERAAEDRDHAAAVHERLVAEAAAAKEGAEAAREALAKAEAELAAAAPEAKPPLQEAVEAAKAAADAAEAAASTAEGSAAAAEKAKAETEAKAKAAEDRAAPKDLKFTTYSVPVSVEVVAEAPTDAP